MLRLNRQYPDDVGVLAVYFLNYIRLKPDQVGRLLLLPCPCFVPAGGMLAHTSAFCPAGMVYKASCEVPVQSHWASKRHSLANCNP